MPGVGVFFDVLVMVVLVYLFWDCSEWGVKNFRAAISFIHFLFSKHPFVCFCAGFGFVFYFRVVYLVLGECFFGCFGSVCFGDGDG